MVCEYPEDAVMVSPAAVKVVEKMVDVLGRLCVVLEEQHQFNVETNKRFEECQKMYEDSLIRPADLEGFDLPDLQKPGDEHVFCDPNSD